MIKELNWLISVLDKDRKAKGILSPKPFANFLCGIASILDGLTAIFTFGFVDLKLKYKTACKIAIWRNKHKS